MSKNNSTLDEISSMISSLGNSPEEPKEEEKTEEVKEVEETEEVEEETEEETEDEEETKGEPDDSPEEESSEEVSELEQLKQELAEAKKAIESLKTPPSDKPEEVIPEFLKDPSPPAERDFVKDFEDLDLEDSEELNKVLNKVYQQASMEAHKMIRTQLPEFVLQQVSALQTLQRIRDDFYSDNPDLTKHGGVVGEVYEALVKKDPNITISSLLPSLASETRKRLGLSPKGPKAKKGNVPPKLPKKGAKAGNISNTPNAPLQDELEEMNKVLNI